MRGNRRQKKEQNKRNKVTEQQHQCARFYSDAPHNLFFVPPDTIENDEVTLRGDTFQHIQRVLRKKSGDTIFLTDGRGTRFSAEITQSSASRIHARITQRLHIERTNLVNIELAFVPLKGHKNDFIIEKGTELGITKFRPFFSRFSVIPHLSAQKLNRFKKIAVSAMLQSQQYYTPDFMVMKDLHDMTKIFTSFDLVLVADRCGRQTVPLNARTILYIVGPEGGFSQDEVARVKNCGATMLSLGSQRLRSETAALCGIMKILTAYTWKEHNRNCL
jgi:16S rRNA (uracil1498-N3)-methyltransferase